MKKKTKVIIILSVVIMLFSLVFYLGFCFAREKYYYLKDTITSKNEKVDVCSTRKYNLDYSWVDNNNTYGHAFGATEEGEVYTNSLEAFKKNYEGGQRVFEIDISITSDYKTICWHDEEYWHLTNELSDDVDYSYENFMNTKICNRYTPLDYKDLINLMNEYKDISIVIDGKHGERENVYLEYYQIVSYAKEVDETILERVIPIIYTEEMLDTVMDVYPFKSIEYDLYQHDYKLEDIVSFCMKTGINLIAIEKDDATDDTINYLKAFGIKVSVFTVNDILEAKEYLEKGVDIICTDVLYNSDFD